MKRKLIKFLGGYTWNELENLRKDLLQTAKYYNNTFEHPSIQGSESDRYYLGKSDGLITATRYLNDLTR